MDAEDIANLRMGTMFLVEAVSRVEGWSKDEFDRVVYMVESAPWYSVWADRAHFRECLIASALHGGRPRKF